MDEFRIPAATGNLSAQSANMALDDIGLGIEVKLPDALQQHRARHDAVGMAHKKLKQQEFPGLKIDAFATARYAAPQQVELHVRDAKEGRWVLQRWSTD